MWNDSEGSHMCNDNYNGYIVCEICVSLTREGRHMLLSTTYEADFEIHSPNL